MPLLLRVCVSAASSPGTARARPLRSSCTSRCGCRAPVEGGRNLSMWPSRHILSALAHGETQVVRSRDNVFKKQERVLKALANESRLRIVDRLSRGECSVGELTELVGSDRSTVSKHLAVLRSHGIALDRREGNVVCYSLQTPCVVGFLACATQVLKERA